MDTLGQIYLLLTPSLGDGNAFNTCSGRETGL